MPIPVSGTQKRSPPACAESTAGSEQRCIEGRRVGDVRPGRCRQRARQQIGVAGDEPDRVERRGEGDAPAPGDPARRRLQAVDTAERRRQPDRAARVAGHGEWHEPGGHGCGRSSARTAGDAGQVPRIACRSSRRVLRRDAPPELVRPRHTDDHGAGVAQRRHHRGVVLRPPPGEHQRPVAAVRRLDVEQLLDRERHAVQRAAPMSGRELGRGGRRIALGGVREHVDEGADQPVPALDRRERVLDAGSDVGAVVVPRPGSSWQFGDGLAPSTRRAAGAMLPIHGSQQ